MNYLKYKNWFLTTIFIYLIGTTACISVKPIYYEDDKKIAESQVEKFHQLFNDEKYDEIYNLYTPKVQNQQSKEQFISVLQNFRASFGRIKNSKIVKSEVNPQAATRLVHMFYETEFEKGKKLEEFDCLVDGQNGIFDFYGQPDKIPGNKE